MCNCLKRTNQQDHTGSIFVGKKNPGGTILFLCGFVFDFFINGRWYVGSPSIIFFWNLNCVLSHDLTLIWTENS